MKRFALMALYVAVACGGSTEPATPGPTNGAITIRFVNPTSSDVYVDQTLGMPHEIRRDQQLYAGPHDCTSPCGGGCECYFCGAPLSVVRRVPPGAALEVVWHGDYYELSQTCGGGQCSCDQAHTAPHGTYHVTLTGGRGRTPPDGQTTGGDPDLFMGNLDPLQPTCSAAADLLLDAQAKTVDAPFACSGG